MIFRTLFTRAKCKKNAINYRKSILIGFFDLPTLQTRWFEYEKKENESHFKTVYWFSRTFLEAYVSTFQIKGL
jgi:hypothetical protein